MYDFDRIISRKGTSSAKYDMKYTNDEKIIPMWVADMDFEVLPEIKEALIKRAEQGIYGYSFPSDAYYQAVIDWMARRHHFHVEKEWIVCTGGVVPAIKLAVQAYTKKEDAVLIMKPIYYPFDASIKDNERKIVECPLVFENGSYSLDYEVFEKKIVENEVKAFILCNPHNPIGKVWNRDDLKKMGLICKKHGVIVISDEIHMDFLYPGHEHVSFYEVDPSFKEFSLVCTAPSKTFNLAGLQDSNIIIADKKMRDRFIQVKTKNGVTDPNIFGLVACQAAYTYGDRWVDELLAYLQGNIQYMKEFFAKHLPMLKVVDPEGLYLVWVDCRGFGMDAKELEDFMLHKAHVWLDEGYIFGQGGEGFERFNLACPRLTLERALHQIKEAWEHLS